jgi:hypothetical protein
MKHLITATISAWITYSIATGRCEADIEAAWSAGYQAYQEDTYLPKPNHKQPDYRLKEKRSG